MSQPPAREAARLGRPAVHEPTEDLLNRIQFEMMKPRAIRKICEEEWAPSLGTFMSWVETDPDVERWYRSAQRAQGEAAASEVIAIADENMDKDSAQGARNAIEARKWFASRMNPDTYGDRLALTGAHGGPIELVTMLQSARKRADAIDADYVVIDDQAVTSEDEELANLLE